MRKRREEIPYARLTARIPLDLHHMLWVMSARTGLSLNRLICLALRDQLPRYERLLSPGRALGSPPPPRETGATESRVDTGGGSDATANGPKN
jgi:hypothetical protein